jgi:hypothetical protein
VVPWSCGVPAGAPVNEAYSEETYRQGLEERAMLDLGGLRVSKRLDVSQQTLRELYDRLYPVVQQFNPDHREMALLILERLILASRGHRCSLQFGKNSIDDGKCCVCQAQISRSGQLVKMTSDWEYVFLYLLVCDACSRQTFGLDFDLLTGTRTSKICRL